MLGAQRTEGIKAGDPRLTAGAATGGGQWMAISPGPRYAQYQPGAMAPQTVGPVDAPQAVAAATAAAWSGIQVTGTTESQRDPGPTGFTRTLDYQIDTGWDPSAYDTAFAQVEQARFDAEQFGRDIGTDITDLQFGSAVGPEAVAAQTGLPFIPVRPSEYAVEQGQVPPVMYAEAPLPEEKKATPWLWIVGAAVAGLLLARGQGRKVRT